MARKKRVLVVTPHFYPEDFKVNDIAFELKKNDFEVHVVTCIPNYPQGKYYKGYSIFKRQYEEVNGVSVYRVVVIPRGNGSGLRLALNYTSYLVSALLTSLYLAVKYRYSHVFVHETSPVTVGLPAILVKKIQRIPLYFWVLDLWPESIIAASSFKSKSVIRLIERLVKYIYNNCDKILISSNGFRKSILEKGDYSEKIEYFPNWAEDVFTAPTGDLEVPNLPDGFNIMFAGNIGEAQNFEVVMQAALLTQKYRNIHYCIVGDGRKRKWVEEFVKTNTLEESVHMYGRYPISHMPFFFDKADVMLLPLKDESIFSLTVPAKLQAYMVSGKPIIGLIKGEGAAIIDESKCGVHVNPNSSEELASAIIEMTKLSKEKLSKLGESGKVYYEHHFNKEMLLEDLVKKFE